MRGQIDDAKTVAQNVAGDAETVTFQGRPRHIHSYLQDFLFRADRIRMPAKMLSGGERNRLLLARLFLQPANVLVLDEPTNDLDAETLELLEELLLEYAGHAAARLARPRVSRQRRHRARSSSKATAVIAEYTGGYEDWIRQRPPPLPSPPFRPRQKSNPNPEPKSAPEPIAAKPAKFLNQERRELEELPKQIEAWEAQLTDLSAQLWDPELYKNQPDTIASLKNGVASLEKRIKDGYARWEELDARRQAAEALA